MTRAKKSAGVNFQPYHLHFGVLPTPFGGWGLRRGGGDAGAVAVVGVWRTSVRSLFAVGCAPPEPSTSPLLPKNGLARTSSHVYGTILDVLWPVSCTTSFFRTVSRNFQVFAVVFRFLFAPDCCKDTISFWLEILYCAMILNGSKNLLVNNVKISLIFFNFICRYTTANGGCWVWWICGLKKHTNISYSKVLFNLN